MASDVEVQRLINFETATDGSAVRLVVVDVMGRTVGIILHIETVTALLMMSPAMASGAIKRVNHDPRMRITYPATAFELERSSGSQCILTLGSPDGFTVSFSLTDDLSRELGRAHCKGRGRGNRLN